MEPSFFLSWKLIQGASMVFILKYTVFVGGVMGLL